jgi:predicted aspartyl protease
MRAGAAFAFAALLLAMPVRGAEVPADAVLADLPFLPAEEGNENDIRIDLGVPGARSLPLLVDTGTPDSFATPRAAQAIGISVRRAKQTPYRRATRLDRDIEIVVNTRRGDTAASAGGEWAVLGARFLANFVIEIDFPRRRVRFLDPDRYQVPERVDAADAAVLPIRLLGRRPVIEVEVNRVRVPAVISTGAPGTLLLPGGWASEAALKRDAAATAKLAPMPGAGRLEAVTADRFQIGPFAELEVPILVAEFGAHGAGARSEAVLGADLLKPYVVRIDYPRKRFWISEPAAP